MHILNKECEGNMEKMIERIRIDERNKQVYFKRLNDDGNLSPKS